MFERPELLYLLLAMPLAVAPGLMAVRAGRRAAGAGAAALRASLFVILVALLAGLRLPTNTGGPRAAGGGRPALRASLFVILVALLAGLRLPLKTPAQRMSVVVAMDASHS